MKILFYTSGLSGIGRVVKGLAVGNALRRREINCQYTILSSSSYSHLWESFGFLHIEIPVENENELSQENFPNSALYQSISRINPDIIIIDLLWFPLYNFIDQLKCKKIFLCLHVEEKFFSMAIKGKRLLFEPKQYDLLLAIEPFKCSYPMREINPLVLMNKDEIMSRETARKKLGLFSNKKVCLYTFNHKPFDLFEKFKEKYSYLENAGYEVIYTTHNKEGIFPVVNYFNGIDFIVGGAGYSLFWEVIYFNKEAIFESYPFMFDDPKWRIENCQNHFFTENGADQLVDLIMNF